MEINFDLGFKSVADRALGEESERAELVSRNIPFGVTFLDRMLRGILPDDLVLLGGYPGSGKTELASRIFQHAASQGKRCHFFALEASEREIERRMKFREFTKLFTADPYRDRSIIPNYKDWFYGDYNQAFSKYEQRVNETIASYRNMHTYYRGTQFDLDTFRKLVFTIAGNTDLILVDHIHYFDFEGPNVNESLGRTMKGIRDIALISKVPVILVAHLRKRSEALKKLVPDLDDFHGTSDLGKICTKAILLAPGETRSSHEFATYMTVKKFRLDGGGGRWIGRTVFNSSINDYEPGFEVGQVSADGQKFEAVKGNDLNALPQWLRR